MAEDFIEDTPEALRFHVTIPPEHQGYVLANMQRMVEEQHEALGLVWTKGWPEKTGYYWIWDDKEMPPTIDIAYIEASLHYGTATYPDEDFTKDEFLMRYGYYAGPLIPPMLPPP